MRLAHATLLASLLLAALALPASAQSFQSSFVIRTVAAPALLADGPQEAVAPWEYNFNSPFSPLAAQGQGATLVWDQPSCNMPGILLTGAMTETLAFPLGSFQPSYAGESRFAVQALPEAPGETVIVCQVSGHVEAVNPFIGPTGTASSAFTVAVPYKGTVSATAPTPIQRLAPGTHASVPLAVANLANSESRLAFELAAPLPPGWSAVLPEALVLESAAKGGQQTNATVLATIAAPRGATGDVPVLLRVTAGSLRDPSLQAPSSLVTLLFHVEGSAEPPTAATIPPADPPLKGKLAPGAGPLLTFGLLGVAAIARRRF